MRALILVMLLAGELAAAQVAGVCGAGKTCSVAKMNVTRSGSGLVCLRSAAGQYDWGFSTVNPNAVGLWVFNAGTNCTAGGVALNNWDTNGVGLAGTVTSVTGFAAPLAFASFPACVPGLTGRLLFDSTAGVWRYCDGGSWALLAHEETVSSYLPVMAPAASIDVTNVGLYVSGVLRGLAGTVMVAGTGAGTFTLDFYDANGPNGSAALCTTGATGCATIVGGTTMVYCYGVAVVGGHNFVVRAHTNGCTTAPALNIIATIGG